MMPTASREDTRTGNKSILIVDDDEIIIDILSNCFVMNGIRVLKAGNGLDGWNIFQKELTDIVLTDIKMPGVDGSKLASRIKNHSPYTTVAVMTGGHRDVGEKLLKDGIADYCFHKPFALSYVCKMLSGEDRVAH
jgi:DNA-binding NtrC family response regulator